MIRLFLILICFSLASCSAYSAQESEFIYDNGGQRDPFVPLIGDVGSGLVDTSEVMDIADVQFQGVAVDSDGNKVVVLNGEIFKKGDKTGPVTIKDIADDYVILTLNEKDYTLNLYEYE